MDKKIPKVFANRIDKKIENNDTYSITRNDDVKVKENRGLDINSKINQIFKSTKYIYKIDVEIVVSTGTITKRIIGRKNGYLITIDNELIKIDDILDINIKYWPKVNFYFLLINILIYKIYFVIINVIIKECMIWKKEDLH